MPDDVSRVVVPDIVERQPGQPLEQAFKPYYKPVAEQRRWVRVRVVTVDKRVSSVKKAAARVYQRLVWNHKHKVVL